MFYDTRKKQDHGLPHDPFKARLRNVRRMCNPLGFSGTRRGLRR